MLKNAIPYQDDLRKKFYEVWYDPSYQYYFGSYWRWIFRIDESGSSFARRDFVSVDREGNLIGYIGYSIDSDVRMATGFCAINFTGNKITFGMDLRTAVNDIFCKFGMETMEFNVIRGNPAERSYDRIVKKIGGKILAVRHGRALDMAGNLCDDKVYEITRAEYLAYIQRCHK